MPALHEGSDTGNKRGEFRALSVRVDNEQYRRLRRFVTNHEIGPANA